MVSHVFASFLYSKVSGQKRLDALKFLIPHSLLSPASLGIYPHQPPETDYLSNSHTRIVKFSPLLLSAAAQHPELPPTSPGPSPLRAVQGWPPRTSRPPFVPRKFWPAKAHIRLL